MQQAETEYKTWLSQIKPQESKYNAVLAEISSKYTTGTEEEKDDAMKQLQEIGDFFEYKAEQEAKHRAKIKELKQIVEPAIETISLSSSTDSDSQSMELEEERGEIIKRTEYTAIDRTRDWILKHTEQKQPHTREEHEIHGIRTFLAIHESSKRGVTVAEIMGGIVLSGIPNIHDDSVVAKALLPFNGAFVNGRWCKKHGLQKLVLLLLLEGEHVRVKKF